MRLLIILSVLLLTACPGPKGDQGDTGSKGSQGIAGTNGTNGQDGTQGNPGVNGTNGSNGSNGNDGAQGDPGAPGTVVTWVQFCPGTTVYPSTFVEGGFCINNNLYAVYSANNGFLVYLPPGNYSSNAINSSCSFTVLPNCQISP